MQVDANKLNEFIGRFVGDLGAAVHAGMVVIGERLGLYKALAAGPATATEPAARTGTDAGYVREWLSSQAAGGCVTYDAASDKFSLTPEQAFTLADEDSPRWHRHSPSRPSWASTITPESIAAARESTRRAGVKNCTFEVV